MVASESQLYTYLAVQTFGRLLHLSVPVSSSEKQEREYSAQGIMRSKGNNGHLTAVHIWRVHVEGGGRLSSWSRTKLLAWECPLTQPSQRPLRHYQNLHVLFHPAIPFLEICPPDRLAQIKIVCVQVIRCSIFENSKRLETTSISMLFEIQVK